MRVLSPTDEMFVILERTYQPMHVAGLFVLSPPEGEGPRFVRALLERYAAYPRPVAPYDERLMRTPLGYCWVRDAHFDLGNHLRHAALPSPGTREQLHAWVASQHEHRLHRDRPLWELHVIEGLAGGRVAIYAKVHHAVLDGVSALRCSLAMFSSDPAHRDEPPLWMKPPFEAKRSPRRGSPVREVIAERGRNIKQQLASLPTLAREARRVASETTAQLLAPRAPDEVQNPLAGHITSARCFGSLSFALPRIEALAATLDRTVNDVVLAICSGALRSYLRERGQLPTRPLVAMVPVSLRRGGVGHGNRVATILANLATHVSDPVERIEQLWSSVQATKDRFREMTDEEIVGVCALSLTPTFLSMVTRGGEAACAYQVIISNVPGPREPLQLDGAALQHIYPVSIVVDHVALNITFTSYAGSLDFGLLACRDAVPDMERLIAHMEASLVDLEQLVQARAAAQ